MADRALVSMAQQFTGLPMGSLIGGPLKAAAEANATMAMTQTKFMLDTCFSKVEITPATTPPTYNYKPIMIKMALKRGVLTPTEKDGKPTTEIQEVTTEFDLPLLTIIPLNSLGVDSADVTFEMEVKSSFSEDNTEEQKKKMEAAASFEAKAGWGPFSVSITGSASYSNEDTKTHSTHYEKSNSAKYTVNVHAGQLPLPKGVNTIIEAFSKAIQPIKMPTTPPPNNNNNNNG